MNHKWRIKSAFVFVLLVGILFGALALIPTLAQSPRHGRAAPDESFAQMMAPSLTGYTIDNSSPTGFIVTGTWGAGAGGYLGNYIWTAGDNSGQEIAVWQPDLDEGFYEIQVHYWAHPNQRNDALYTVYYDDGGTPAADARHINQQVLANGLPAIGESGWLSLPPRYHFTAGTNGYVTLTDLTTTWGSGVNVVADAVRFLPENTWVDDNYCVTCTNGGHLWGVTAFNNIPEGVLAVADRGTVWVNPGVYLTPITVSKAITLYGVIVGSDRPFITATTGTAIDVRAGGVTVTGFNVGGGGTGVPLHFGIANYGTLGWSTGIVDVKITNNIVHGFPYPVYFTQARTEISANHIYTGTKHLSVENSITGTLLSGNVITGSLGGTEVGIDILNDAWDLTATGNRVTGCTTGIHVWQDAPAINAQKVSLQGNTVAGGTTGVLAGNSGGGWTARTLLIGGAYTYSSPNQLYGNTGYELQLSGYGGPIDATRNYWGMCLVRQIEDQIWHNYDAVGEGVVTYVPALCVPYTLTVQALPTSLPADGMSTSIITVTVRDVLNRLVDPGTMVGVTSTAGSTPLGLAEAEGPNVTVSGAGWGGAAPGARASGGWFMGSANPGDAIRWNFTGTAVSLIYLRAAAGGTAEIYIDDPTTPVTTVNMSGALAGPPYEWLVEDVISSSMTYGAHWIEARVPAVPVGPAWIDAFRSGKVTDASGQISTTLTAPTSAGSATVWATVYNGKIITDTSVVLSPYVTGTATVTFAAADVYVTKSALPTTVNPGQEVTYTIRYGNNGPEAATGVLVTDTLPANFTRVRSSSVPNYEGPNPFSGNRWVWSITGGVAPGATGIITLVAKPNLTGWPAATVVTNIVQIGTIVAESSGANNQASAAVTVVPAVPASVTVTVVPNILPANGAANAAVTATVRDANNNPVVDGTVVTFSTTLAGCGFEPTGATPKVVLTNGGAATATLRAGTLAGTTVITAHAGTAFGTTTATLVPLEPYTVTMSARPTWIRVSPGGELTTTLYITVTDRHNNLANGARVNLTTTAGSFVGSGTTTLAVTTTQGITVAGLASSCTPTWVTVTAGITTAGRPTTSLTVEFRPGLPATITAVADPVAPTPIRVCGGAAGTAVVTATIIDSCGNLVEDGTEVSFNVVEGERGDTYPRLTRTVSGVASTLVRTKAYRFGERFLNVYILSRREARDITSTQRIDLEVGYAAQMTLTPSPATIQVNNKRSIIRAIVSDCAGNPVQNGTVVTFTADALGTVSPTVTTTFDGLAQTTFESGCTTGDAVVTALVDGRSFTTTVKLEAGPPLWVYAQLRRPDYSPGHGLRRLLQPGEGRHAGAILAPVRVREHLAGAWIHAQGRRDGHGHGHQQAS